MVKERFGGQHMANIIGTSGNDSLDASSASGGTNVRGEAGNDTILGGGLWYVFADYLDSPGAVTVTLSTGTGTAQDGWGNTDTLINVSSARGSAFNDTITGGPAPNGGTHFGASAGNDSYIGSGTTFTSLDYSSSDPSFLLPGVSVTMSGPTSGTAVKGGGLGTDSFVNVNAVSGGSGNDSYQASATLGTNLSSFEGFGGNDTINGANNPTVELRYANSPNAINADLNFGTISNGWGGIDQVSNVGLLHGTALGDFLKGATSLPQNQYIYGDAGSDTIDGAFGGRVIADYSQVFNGNGIVADLNAGSVQDGLGGTDHLQNFVGGLRATNNNDMVFAKTSASLLNGPVAGNSSIEAGFGNDTISYASATSSIIVSLGLNQTANVNKLGIGSDTLTGFEQIIGTSFNDTFSGSISTSFTTPVAMVGGAGNDSLIGANNFWNQADYRTSPNGVNVDLGLSTAQDGFGGTDTLSQVVFVHASAQNDTLKGSGSNDTFDPYLGSDSIDGGNGFNSLDYTALPGGTTLTVNWTSATSGTVSKFQSGVPVGTDSFVNMQRVVGGSGGDSLSGTSLATGSTVTLEGYQGNDTIDGRGSFLNLVSYNQSFRPVSVDLAAGTAQDGWGNTDTLANVRRVQGGSSNDTLLGAATDDGFTATGGSDSIDGRAGLNTYDGTGQGNALTITLTADAIGNATKANGSAGTDSFINIQIVQASNGADSIQGFAGATSNEWLRGMNGNDTIDAASNAHNIVDYNGLGTAITATLATGVVTGQGTDQLLHFSAIRGSTGNDIFKSGAGNFIIDGGNGFGTLGSVTSPGVGGGDALDYRGYSSPITITSVTNNAGATPYYSGVITKPDGADSFSSIRGIFASTGNDSLSGTADTVGSNAFVLRGEAGADTIDGRGTNNALDYIDSPTGVLVTLQATPGGPLAGTAQDGWGSTDVIIGFHSVRGADAGNDTLNGSDGNDFFWGTRGNDSFIGNGASDSVNYNNGLFQNGFTGSIDSYTTGVGAGLFGYANGTVFKAGGQVDTLVSINSVLGNTTADVLHGLNGVAYSWNNVNLRGNGGNDTIYGYNNGSNRAEYASATSAVSVDLGLGTDANGMVLGTAQDGQGGTDSLVGVITVRGSNFNDTLLGSALSDTFIVGTLGSHLVDGRGGANDVRYNNADAVTIDLGTTLAAGGFGGYQGSLAKASGTDTLLNIASAQGGSGDDTILGSLGNNLLSGGAGNNSIDGRDGTDSLNYRPFTGITAPTHGAVINLNDGVTGTATNPWDGIDTLANIEGAIGSQIADDITGAVLAGGGTSFIRGDGGNDTLRAPTDGTHITADYASSLSAITANLVTGVVADDGWFGGTDTLVHIQAIRGSAWADSITVGAGNFTVDGGGGRDTVFFTLNSSQVTSLARDTAGTWTVGTDAGTYLLTRVEALVFANGVMMELLAPGVTGVGLITGTAGNDSIRPGLSSAGVLGSVDDLGDTIAGNGGNDQIQGGAGSDSIVGGAGNDSFWGSAGNDSYAGNGGFDRISYLGQGPGGVSVNLTTGTATNGHGGHDVLAGIRDVEGSTGNDTLVGVNTAELTPAPGGVPGLFGTRFLGTAGSDSLDGTLQLARMWGDYSNLPGTISATYTDMLHATLSKSGGGTDTLVNVTGIIGTDGNDSLAGPPTGAPSGIYSFGVTFIGGAGNDSINGSGGARADYSTSTSAANINLSTGTATDGLGGTDTLTNVTQVRGTSFNDTILGSASGETFMVVNGGNHSIDGGTGTNTYRYFGTDDVLVDITLASTIGGFANKPGGAVDTLKNINGIYTGDGNDTLIGSSGNDTLQGAGGNNFLDGRGGDNFVRYDSIVTSVSTQGVVVNLQTGHVANPWGGQDFLLNVQNAIGTNQGDYITGTSANNATFSTVRGMVGNDTLAAPFANTHVQADYSQDIAGVTVNLAAGTAADGWGGHDQLINIQAARGSNFADNITGSALNDIITPGTGNDTVDGGDGIDIVVLNSSKAATTLTVSGTGIWSAVGPDGTDELRNVSILRFNDGDVVLNGLTNGDVNVEGTAGNDTITRSSVSANVLGTVSDGGQTIFGGGGGNDQFQGGAGNDMLLGGNGNDTFFGGAGNDTFTANGGQDRVSYSNNGQTANGVTVDLTTGTATNTTGGHDELHGIRDIQGSAGNDTLIGTNVLSSAAGIAGYPSSGTNFTASLGSDSIDGTLPLGATSMTYSSIGGNETVSFSDLYHATVIKSLGGTDTLVNVQGINGSNGDDSISGATVAPGLGVFVATRNLQGGLGNDTIDGHGLNVNRPRYSNASSAVNINLETGIVSTDGQGGHDLLINVVNVRGSNFNDTIIGSHNDDTIQSSMLGSRLLDGAGGHNTFSYFLFNAEDVLIDLGTTAAADGGGGTQGFVLKANGLVDTLLRFNGASAADGNDTLLGTPGDDTLTGGAGNNSMDGRDGHDVLGYGTSFYNFVPTHGVVVDLGAGTATNQWDGTDTFQHVQSVVGTPFGDSLMGLDPADGSYGFLQGRAGNDTLAAPHAGTHVLADYSRDEAGVVVNLALGTATDGFGGHDQLININAVRGSAFADSLTGSAGNDSFIASAGADTVFGNGGTDVLQLTSITQAQASWARNADASWTVTTASGTTKTFGITTLQFSDASVTLSPALSLSGTGGLTNQPHQTITGTTSLAYAGSLVSILEGATVLGTGLVLADGSFSAVVNLAGQGLHTLLASLVDPYLGTIQSSGLAFTLDTVAPTVAITTAAGATRFNTQDLAGIGEAGTTVTLLEGTTALGSTLVGTDGSWSLQVTFGSAQGRHVITARDTDAAGNVGTSPALAFTLDTIAPSVAITSAGGMTNLARQIISGTGERGATVQLLDGITTLGSVKIDATGAWSKTVTLSGQGEHVITARATDAVGNAGTALAPVTITLDTVAPVVAFTSAGGLINNRTQLISGTGEAGTTVVLKEGTTTLGTAVVDKLGQWSLSATLGVAQGSHVVTAQDTDAVGNVGTSSPLSFTLDTIAPVVAITSTGGLINNRTQLISGTGEAGTTVVVKEGAATLGTTVVDGLGLWSVSATLAAAQGSHAVTAQDTDAAGNVGSSRALSFTLDTIAPAIAISSPGGATNVARQTIAGTGEAGTTVLLFDGATSLGSVRVGATGTWSKLVTFTTQGAHAITVVDTDAAGNSSTAGVTYTFDTIAPTPTIDSLPSTTIQPVRLVTGRGEVGSTVSLFEGTALLGTGTVGTDGTWSISATLAGAGRHSLIAKALDAAGNTANSAAASTRLLVADTNGVLTLPQDIAIRDADFAGLSGLTTLYFGSTGTSSAVLASTAASALASSVTVATSATTAGLNIDASGLGSGKNLILVGTAGADSLAGGGGADYIRGGGGADKLTGGDGNDTFDFQTLAAFTAPGRVVDGGTGTNQLNLGFTDAIGDADFVGLSHLQAIFLYGSGAESLSFGVKAAAAFGSSIFVSVGAGITSLVANGAALGSGTALVVQGSAGADSLVGGAGNDVFTGGAGADLFDLSVGGFDTILDFDVAADVIRLAGLGVGSFAALQGRISYAAGNASIAVDASHQVTLQHVVAGSLTAADFLFV